MGDKQPQPEVITEEMFERCTCDEYEWAEHECPYNTEIHEDYTPCVCCPYCTKQCFNDI